MKKVDQKLLKEAYDTIADCDHLLDGEHKNGTCYNCSVQVMTLLSRLRRGEETAVEKW